MLKTIVLALFIAAAIASCTPSPIGQPVQSTTVFDTGPFACDQARQWTWVAPTGMHIKQAETWQGMDMGARADFSVVLYRQSDQSFIFRHNWDHYAEPTGNNDQLVSRNFEPDYLFLAAGDSLVLDSVCIPYAGPTRGHIIVTIWYTE